MIRVKLPHLIEFHYKSNCPYCARTERFLISPLEALGVVRVVRVNIDYLEASKSYAENLRLSYAIGDDKVGAPVLYDVHCGLYFLPVGRGEETTIEEAVREMAISFIDHLCRTVVVYKNSLGETRFLSPDDLLPDPLIREAVQFEG